VLWPKGEPLQFTRDEAKEVQEFFMHEWIVVVSLDRSLAETARELVWNHRVRYKDAVRSRDGDRLAG
jgi:hypothetical protein